MNSNHTLPIAFQRLYSYQAFKNNKDYHMHDCFELFFLLEGDLNYYIGQSLYHVTSSSIITINPHEPHKCVNNKDDRFERIYFHIPFSFIEKYSTPDINLTDCFTDRPVGKNNILLLSQLQKQHIVNIYNKMNEIKESTRYSYGNSLLFDTYVLQLLIYINDLFYSNPFAAPDKYSDEVRFITEYIDAHITDNITLDILADKLSLNKYYLSHKFKHETDTTILQYLILARISKAKQFLSNGMNVTETCYNTGFNDYSNFITTFKKVTGYTPKKYQQSFRI